MCKLNKADEHLLSVFPEGHVQLLWECVVLAQLCRCSLYAGHVTTGDINVWIDNQMSHVFASAVFKHI